MSGALLPGMRALRPGDGEGRNGSGSLGRASRSIRWTSRPLGVAKATKLAEAGAS